QHARQLPAERSDAHPHGDLGHHAAADADQRDLRHERPAAAGRLGRRVHAGDRDDVCDCGCDADVLPSPGVAVTSLPDDLQPAEFIRHARQLRALVDQLRGTPLLAVDTESNSLYAYYEQVCLIQLSTREKDWIVDPLALDDLSPLGDVLGDPATEIVFHAAEYDIVSLKRDFGFHFGRVFDTMMAARICGWEQVGLGSILES